MSSRASLKTELRKHLREQRRQLSAEQQDRAAQGIVMQLSNTPGLSAATHIGLYDAVDGEVGTALLARWARDNGKIPYLPVVEGEVLRFAEWRNDDELTANRFGIGEPPTGIERVEAQALDVLCLPLVGWNRNGVRLGMGGGYYDRTLAQPPRPLIVGLAHSCQEMEALPEDSWDITLDWVMTESERWRCPAG